MPVTWHFLVRRLSTSSIGMIPLASIPFCVALTDQVHMFTKDIRAGGAILCPIVLGWKLCLSALISFVCARDPRCFSDLITGVGQCRTFFPWTGFCCRLIWWLVLLPEVLVFSVIALYALHFLVWAQGLSYLPSICSERYCGMLTAPVFVSPWFYSRLLFLLCYYEATPAHAFLVSNSIAGLVTWGGGCCFVGLYFLRLLLDCFHSACYLHLL